MKTLLQIAPKPENQRQRRHCLVEGEYVIKVPSKPSSYTNGMEETIAQVMVEHYHPEGLVRHRFAASSFCPDTVKGVLGKDNKLVEKLPAKPLPPVSTSVEMTVKRSDGSSMSYSFPSFDVTGLEIDDLTVLIELNKLV